MSLDLETAPKIIDVDTHVVEPYDLWTSRVSVKRYGDLVPHVAWDENAQEDAWYFGDTRICGAAHPAYFSWTDYPPNHPRVLSDADPRNWDAALRLKVMDEYGVQAQVLYPNVAGFGTGRFSALDDPELMLACVRAYNDYLTEWSSVDPQRLLPVTALPFWDLDETIKEMARCADLGHRGAILSLEPEHFGQPHLTHEYWEPLWSAAEEIGYPLNFHIGAGDRKVASDPWDGIGAHAKFASTGVKFFINNAKGVADLIFSGICHRHPNLKFVSVESGIGWIPFALEAMDWQWKNCAVSAEHPEYDLLPSEYFRRQLFGCFWFERDSATHAIEQLGSDCVMFETDFPHPTAQVPGPATTAVEPQQYLADVFGHLPAETSRKIVHDNAARLYRIG
ncbi:MAG: amidohydrolase family protein [Ilumatobacteraceae bacterium]